MFESNPYVRQYNATRWRLRIGLIVAGAVAGAAVGAAPVGIAASAARLSYAYRDTPHSNRLIE